MTAQRTEPTALAVNCSGMHCGRGRVGPLARAQQYGGWVSDKHSGPARRRGSRAIEAQRSNKRRSNNHDSAGRFCADLPSRPARKRRNNFGFWRIAAHQNDPTTEKRYTQKTE